MQSATADDLARAMKVTSADARYHLSGLQSDGLVEVIEIRKRAGRGRPTKVFGISRLIKGDNLSQLTDAILTDWLSFVESDRNGDAFERVANRMTEDYQPVITSNITHRLANAIDHINNKQYNARWEAHASGPRIIFESCPYASVISRHPEICLLDVKMLQKYTGKGIEQLMKREKGIKNIPICVFKINE
jgi:predicted ArsR family transcriptional regulator